MSDTIHVLGEGGVVIAMDVPLPDAIAHRMTTGQLRRVNEDGSPYIADVPSLPSQAPSTGAPKAEWVGWAVANGAEPADAEAMTKSDLIEAHGV
ncbi:hypothetical protein [Kitasatospora sp. NPDC091276]|uniref:hypothetical protein n=1 Tax=unclassified Kitasatospora TaxID=2633591 RepID=UPI003418BC95